MGVSPKRKLVTNYSLFKKQKVINKKKQLFKEKKLEFYLQRLELKLEVI